MRIQHNIMAMGAYRNYTNNLSAMQKNLEKLSSGYKINRAGDDAAGLAISEKMRAQITGLTAAQKNAKDGISLVQTAEGALTEVHDMLNRMVQLATQSANGTYDNETDRDQLQKEMNQLRSEIDRIADASNFNGIKLLDGSMDSDAGLTGVKYTDVELKDLMKLFVNKDDGVNQGDPLGGKDIMEKDSGETGPGSFEIDLDGIGELDIAEGQKFAIKVGDATIESDKLAAGKYDSKKLAEALDGKEITINADGKDRVFTAKADGGKLTFTTEDPEDFKLSANDKVDWKVLEAETPEPDFEPAAVEGTLEATTSTALDGKGPIAAKFTSTGTISGAANLQEGDVITIGTDTYTIVDDHVHDVRGDEVSLSQVSTDEGLAKFIAEKLNDANNDYDVSVDADGKIVYEAYAPGAVGTSGPGAAASGPAALTITRDDGTGNMVAVTGVTTTVTLAGAADTDTGVEASGPNKFIKLSDADNDAIAAAAQELGAADGAKLTIKVDSTNNKAQLFAGDKKISEVDYTADGNTSTTVTFKDEAGNTLLKASLVKVEGDEDAFGTDGFDTGLTFKAQVGTPDGAGGAAGSSEDGLMALAEGDDAGTPSAIAGSGSASIAISNDATAGTQAVYSVEVNDTDGTATNGKKIDGVTIPTWDTDLNTTMGNFVDTYNADTTKAYEASWNSTDSKLVLTAKEAGVVNTKPQTDLSGTDADMTEDTAGVDPTPANKRADASGLTADAIKGVADGIEGIADGDVKIELNSDNKLELKIGDKVVGISDEVVNGTATTFTMKGVDADSTALGTITLTGNVGTADITGALSTGLTYTAATSGPDDPGTDDPGTVGGNNLVGDLTQTTHLKDLPDFGKDTDLSADQITELESIFDNAGSGTGTVTIPGSNASLALKDIDLTGVNTIGDVAQKIFDAADAAVKAANENVAEGGKKYEVVGVYSDAAYTNLLAGPGDAAGTQAISANDGFYIKTRELTDTPVDDGTVEVAGGTINSGLRNVKDNVTGSSDQLAHVVVDFNEVGAWSDGAKITIGDTDYTVAVGKDSKFKGAANVIDLTDMEAGNIKKDVAAQRLTVAANANKTFVVGHDGTGKTVLKQRSDVKDKTEMETQEKIAKYLGVSTADPDSVKAATVGKGLKLQIGDTAEGFNQLTVQIKDMHAEALGLNDIQISDQESAAKAIDVIKDAINSVSDLRGTLGATQNRLDHTINNLSVMTENITDAESTIRDTDVAEEMMAYTKNNILIQSAQAMLAQANQVPQGVLQLLQ